MRKYTWIVVLALIGCMIALASCERIARVVAPATPEPEPEPPTEMVVETPPEPTIDPEPETVEPETPVDTVVVEPVTSGVKAVPSGIEGPVVCVIPAQITSPAVGAQLQVSIQIAQAADVTGYELTLAFDPTALRYVGSSNADYLPAGDLELPTVASENSVYRAAVSLTDAASASSGTLATITFEVIAAKASTLTLSEVTLTDSNAAELSLTALNGEISAP